MRKLAEPKSVQTWFDLSQGTTSEERFYNSLRLLEQWNFDYDNNRCMAVSLREKKLRDAHLSIIAEKTKLCAGKIDEIMDKLYADIKNTPIFKKVRSSLLEASKQLIKLEKVEMSEKGVRNYANLVDEIMKDVELITTSHTMESIKEAPQEVVTKIKNESIRFMHNRIKGEDNPESIPEVEYETRAFMKYKPAANGGTNSLSIFLQQDVLLKVNETTKLDLSVRIKKLPRGIHLVTIRNSELTDREILINTELVTVFTEEYMVVSLQNNSDMEIRIPAGTKVVDVQCRKSTLNNSNIEIIVEKEAEIGKEIEIGEHSALSPPPPEKGVGLRVQFLHIEREDNFSIIDEAIGVFSADMISIGNVKINIIGDRFSRIQEIDKLRLWEDDNLLRSSRKIEVRLPTMYTAKQGPDADIEADSEKAWKNSAGQALLAADLLNNKKLSLDTLQIMQGQDKEISRIRESLLGNPGAYNTFILKSGLVCKKYTLSRMSVTYIGIYVPTEILSAVIMYVHRKNLHTSVSQTQKEFAANYYHPKANKIIKEICRDCVICTQSRNKEKRGITIGRERTLKPEKPREGISADILYFPQAASGHTHGLLIADLFSLYLHFYPLKSKSSTEIAAKFRAYFASHGIPKSIYTDSDMSFRGECEREFRLHHILHVTSFPYTQKENAVESQVRIFKNAYRAAILENEIFKVQHWDKLYPLVICRLNALISKYGMSRESVHFGQIVDSSLPLITDSELFQPLEEDLKQLSDRFRDKIGKFLNKRKRNKELYKIGKERKFYIHELVMKANYVPDSLLDKVYTGPFRIIGLSSGGAQLKDVKSGEEISVSFENIRKIKLDELLSLLPQDFDKEVLEGIDTYRYRRGDERNDQDKEKDSPEWVGNKRTLRSGKLYTVKLDKLPNRERKSADRAYWRCEKIVKRAKVRMGEPILRRKGRVKQEFAPEYIKVNSTSIQHKEINGEKIRKSNNKRELRIYSSKYESTFKSPDTGTLIIKMSKEKEIRPGRLIQFGEITVHFY